MIYLIIVKKNIQLVFECGIGTTNKKFAANMGANENLGVGLGHGGVLLCK